MRVLHVFLSTFLVALLVQGWLWQHIEFIDKYMWINHLQHVVRMDDQVFDKTVYGHPGTPAMDIAIAVHWLFRIGPEPALLGSLALLNSLSIASAATLAFILKPASRWWLALAGMLMVNRLYFSSTPPTAVISPLLTFIILLTWWLYKKGKLVRWPETILWGVSLGIAGATRADMSGLFALGMLALLIFRLPWLKTTAMILLALGTFSAVDPFMWWMPIRHVFDLLHVMRFHYAEYDHYRLSLTALLLISPLSLISLALATVWAALHRRLPQPVPRSFMVWLITLTLGIGAILLRSQFQADRYFFPLAFLWEALLPLFLLEGVKQLRFDWIRSTYISRLTHRLATSFVLFLLVGSQLTLLLHLYWLPEVKLICPSRLPTIFCQTHKEVVLW